MEEKDTLCCYLYKYTLEIACIYTDIYVCQFGLCVSVPVCVCTGLNVCVFKHILHFASGSIGLRN